MSVLKNLETKIAELVEGAFGRAFRSELRPVEIARKLAREMEEHKAVSISRVYVPNEYAVYVSSEDRERFADYEDALVTELEGYLLEHARQERLALLSRPQITFNTDERLALGEFGIQARLVRAPADPQAEPEQGEAGHTMIYGAQRLTGGAAIDPHAAKALVVAGGRRLVVGRSGALLGRSRDCDIVLPDSNISRHHAEIRPTDEGWEIVDLGSTNGVIVDGRRARDSMALRGGEQIELGTTKMRFELE
jgi:hypothetical protein